MDNYPLSIIHYPLSIIHYPLSIIKMRRYTTTITAVLTQNMQAAQFTNLGNSLKDKKIESIRTRGGGMSVNKKVITSEANLQKMTLALHTDGSDTLHQVGLAHVLEQSKGANASHGMALDSQIIDWDSSQVIAEDGATLTTGEVVELVITYWK